MAVQQKFNVNVDEIMHQDLRDIEEFMNGGIVLAFQHVLQMFDRYDKNAKAKTKDSAIVATQIEKILMLAGIPLDCTDLKKLKTLAKERGLADLHKLYKTGVRIKESGDPVEVNAEFVEVDKFSENYKKMKRLVSKQTNDEFSRANKK